MGQSAEPPDPSTPEERLLEFIFADEPEPILAEREDDGSDARMLEAFALAQQFGIEPHGVTADTLFDLMPDDEEAERFRHMLDVLADPELDETTSDLITLVACSDFDEDDQVRWLQLLDAMTEEDILGESDTANRDLLTAHRVTAELEAYLHDIQTEALHSTIRTILNILLESYGEHPNRQEIGAWITLLAVTPDEASDTGEGQDYLTPDQYTEMLRLARRLLREEAGGPL